jgi:hypothetical protein
MVIPSDQRERRILVFPLSKARIMRRCAPRNDNLSLQCQVRPIEILPFRGCLVQFRKCWHLGHTCGENNIKFCITRARGFAADRFAEGRGLACEGLRAFTEAEHEHTKSSSVALGLEGFLRVCHGSLVLHGLQHNPSQRAVFLGAAPAAPYTAHNPSGAGDKQPGCGKYP